MTQTVLFGGGGMLARAMDARCRQRTDSLHSFGHSEIDITSAEQVHDAIPSSTRWVVNCAAWTDVDGAESEEARATLVNGEAVGYLAKRCASVGATLVHFSTDYVFSGEAHVPYEVDSPTCPINAYGRSKLAGEQKLARAGCRFLLVRTSWLYAPWGKNFVRTMLGLVKSRDSVRVVSDQTGRPTSVETLAEAVVTLMDRGVSGTYHVTDGGECSWFELARAIAEDARTKCRVLPCSSSEFPRPAKRPRYSVLGLTRSEAVLGPRPHWREPLSRTVKLLERAVQLGLLMLFVCSSAGCSSASMPDPAPAETTSGIDGDKHFADLDSAERERLCQWVEAKSEVVQCEDGSTASHFREEPDACREGSVSQSCSASVAQLETCLNTDPCDAERLAESCVPLVACSLAGGGGDDFACADGIARVPSSVVCDGVEDCPDASDESGCGQL